MLAPKFHVVRAQIVTAGLGLTAPLLTRTAPVLAVAGLGLTAPLLTRTAPVLAVAGLGCPGPQEGV